ncbi:MAG: hypothetical protein GTO02_14715 [Candidatus Dadabacteria bacterium]|nr:hypothetical protein [Candidatus Dadabacteria bacterium]NIQ15595.1 hypothetical protein [Candidatus Dadabacteria bacterium]
MKVNITTRHFNNRRESKYIREYSLKKIRRLDKYMDPEREPTEVNLIISKEKLRYVAEINLNTGHLKATASVETDEIHSVIDKVFDSIIKQLRRRTDKQVSTKRRKSSKPIVTPEISNENIIDQNGLNHKILQSKPMSLDEAILQLKVLDDQFLIFRNSETLEMNVLYKNGNSKIINLVTP